MQRELVIDARTVIAITVYCPRCRGTSITFDGRVALPGHAVCPSCGAEIPEVLAVVQAYREFYAHLGKAIANNPLVVRLRIPDDSPATDLAVA